MTAASPELALERRAARLEGESISRVLYQQLSWSEPGLACCSGPGPHSVELAVHLETEAGRRFRIGWADELQLRHGFGIAIDEVRVVDRDQGPLQDAGASWRGLLGRRVERCCLHWREIEKAIRSSFKVLLAVHADHLTRPDYPQTVEIDVGGAAVFISAARLLEEGGALGFTNHLLVLFDRGDLARLGLL